MICNRNHLWYLFSLVKGGPPFTVTVTGADPNVLQKHLTIKTFWFKIIIFNFSNGCCTKYSFPVFGVTCHLLFCYWLRVFWRDVLITKPIIGNRSIYTFRHSVNIFRYKVTRSSIYPNRKQTRLRVSIDNNRVDFGHAGISFWSARCWKVFLITTRAQATPTGRGYYLRHTRLFASRKLPKLQGSFNTLRKQQRNTSRYP